MRITKLRLKNVRSIREMEVRFDRSGSPTVLIGKNGTCKTSILRAVAIGLADARDAGVMLSDPTGVLVTEGEKNSEIEIDLDVGTDEPLTLQTEIEFDQGQDVLRGKRPKSGASGLLVCGYGIGRRSEGKGSFRRYRIIDSAASLFGREAELTSIELTLRRLHDHLGTDRYQRGLTGIKRALGLPPSVRINLPKGGGVEISGRDVGGSIPLEGWADGYRRTLSWILDVYAWAMRVDCVKDSGGVRGVLLVDEIDQHLHPSLQLTLLPRLRKILPELQIVATTHSPFVALGADPANIVALDRKGRRVDRQPEVPDFVSYTVEDVASDPRLFDAPVVEPDTERKLKRYRKLSSKPKETRSDRESKALIDLAEELSSRQIPASRTSTTIDKLDEILKKHNL